MSRIEVFQFDPNLSDAPLPAGQHMAEVMRAEARFSKAGNAMLELTLRINAPQGHTVMVRDYLVPTPRAKWKIKQLCAAAGIDYAAGAIDPTQLHRIEVGVEIAVEEDRDGRERCIVKGYFHAGESGDTAPPRRHVRPDDEDVPF